jgi:outer membrane lipoprotein-sorting protein
MPAIGLLVAVMAAQANARLERVLLGWEQAGKSVQQGHLVFRLVNEDSVFRTKEVFNGESFFRKPDLFRVDLKDEKGRLKSIVLWNGKDLHFFDFEKRQEFIYRVPAGPAQGWFVSYYSQPLLQHFRRIASGIPLSELKDRFIFQFAWEDRFYDYLRFKPTTTAEPLIDVALDKEKHHIKSVRSVEPSGALSTCHYIRFETELKTPLSAESLSKDLRRFEVVK